MSDNQSRSMYESMAHLSRKRPRWNFQTYCLKNLALRFLEKPPTSEAATAEKRVKWSVTVSAEMVTEKDDEVKEDEEVEADVVKGADSPIIDEARLCGSNKAKMLFSVLRGLFEEETDRETEKKTLWSQQVWKRTFL